MARSATRPVRNGVEGDLCEPSVGSADANPDGEPGTDGDAGADGNATDCDANASVHGNAERGNANAGSDVDACGDADVNAGRDAHAGRADVDACRNSDRGSNADAGPLTNPDVCADANAGADAARDDADAGRIRALIDVPERHPKLTLFGETRAGLAVTLTGEIDSYRGDPLALLTAVLVLLDADPLPDETYTLSFKP